MKIAVFWHVAPCNLVDTDQYFRGAYCQHQVALMKEAVNSSEMSVSTRLHGTTSQETAVFSLLHVQYVMGSNLSPQTSHPD
jgi:hypothetical protein